MNYVIPKSVKVVWFDLDDTLIDFTTNSRRALEKLYSAYRLDKWWSTPEQWIKNYELHNMQLWSDYAAGRVSREFLRMERFRAPLHDAGMPDDEARRKSVQFDPSYLDMLALERELMPGAVETLLKLRNNGYWTGVLSNGFAEVQHRKIRNAGLSDLIDLTVLSDDIGITKPDVRIYNHAMSRSNITEPEAHLMIGDNLLTDIKGAKQAGWHAAALIAPRIAHLAPKEMPCPCISSLSEITVFNRYGSSPVL